MAAIRLREKEMPAKRKKGLIPGDINFNPSALMMMAVF
jgi:hypothetical protein